MRETFDELARLHAAATQGEWRRSKRPYKGDNCKHFEIEAAGRAFWVAKVLCFDRSGVDGVDPQYEANADWIAASKNAFPAILEYVRELEGERDDLREESAYIQQQLEWIEENGDTYTKESLLDFIRRTIHAIDHTAVIKEALATRDAKQRREGAAEWLENAAKEGGYYERSSEGMLEEAKQLREGKV